MTPSCRFSPRATQSRGTSGPMSATTGRLAARAPAGLYCASRDRRQEHPAQHLKSLIGTAGRRPLRLQRAVWRLAHAGTDHNGAVLSPREAAVLLAGRHRRQCPGAAKNAAGDLAELAGGASALMRCSMSSAASNAKAPRSTERPRSSRHWKHGCASSRGQAFVDDCRHSTPKLSAGSIASRSRGQNLRERLAFAALARKSGAPSSPWPERALPQTRLQWRRFATLRTSRQTVRSSVTNVPTADPRSGAWQFAASAGRSALMSCLAPDFLLAPLEAPTWRLNRTWTLGCESLESAPTSAPGLNVGHRQSQRPGRQWPAWIASLR